MLTTDPSVNFVAVIKPKLTSAYILVLSGGISLVYDSAQTSRWMRDFAEDIPWVLKFQWCRIVSFGSNRYRNTDAKDGEETELTTHLEI